MHSRGIQGLCKMIGIESNGSKKKMLHRILNKVLPSSSYIEECVNVSTSSITETSSPCNHGTMPNSPSNSTMNSSIHNNHHTTHSNSNSCLKSKTRNSIPNVSDLTSSFSSLDGIPLVSGISFRSFASIIKKGTSYGYYTLMMQNICSLWLLIISFHSLSISGLQPGIFEVAKDVETR